MATPMTDSKKLNPNPYNRTSNKSIQVRIPEQQMAKLVNHYRNPSTQGRWLQDSPIPPASKIVSRLINDFFTLQQQYRQLKKKYPQSGDTTAVPDPQLYDLEQRVKQLETQMREVTTMKEP